VSRCFAAVVAVPRFADERFAGERWPRQPMTRTISLRLR
jgi:hypothetical protein